MRRPRWHDVLIVAGVVALLLAGLWALWWDDLRSYLHPHAKPPTTTIPSPTARVEPSANLTVVTNA